MNRPRIIVNCAMSADGKIALPSRKQMRISSDEDMKRVFELRNECDAILVGIGAVLTDDPKLTVKEKYVTDPKHPNRVVLDTHARMPHDALVVNDVVQTLIFIGEEANFQDTFSENVSVISSRINEEGCIDISFVLETLYQKGIRSLLVEGGGTIIWSFLQHGFFDDLFVYIGPMVIGGVSTPTMADGVGVVSFDDVIRLRVFDFKKIGKGILIHYKPE